MRLDKYLADMGIGTRSEVKQYIRRKQVQVNGVLSEGPQQKVEPLKDHIVFQGREIGYLEYEYFMFHKPGGCVSAVTDQRYQTVMDYIVEKNRKDLFPVGRLDLDTEGLLLITNDGALSHELLAPGRHIPKTYFARISGKVTEEDVRLFAKGVDIGEKKLTQPAHLQILSSSIEESEENCLSEIELTITEGKFHQVKRMFAAVGKKVLYLKRISMGNLKLDESLPPGAYRRLTKAEVDCLKSCERRRL